MAPKRKLSRKAHLAALVEAKKARTATSQAARAGDDDDHQDPDYPPNEDGEADGDDEGDKELPPMSTAGAGIRVVHRADDVAASLSSVLGSPHPARLAHPLARAQTSPPPSKGGGG